MMELLPRAIGWPRSPPQIALRCLLCSASAQWPVFFSQGAKSMSRSKYVVRPDAVKPYSPVNHQGTVNRRLVGRENVGARQVEVVLGVAAKGGGALKHSHPGIEQVCYMLEGRARVEVGDDCIEEIGPGEAVFFPADVPHVFTTISEQPVRVLLVYAPPYAESGAIPH